MKHSIKKNQLFIIQILLITLFSCTSVPQNKETNQIEQTMQTEEAIPKEEPYQEEDIFLPEQKSDPILIVEEEAKDLPAFSEEEKSFISDYINSLSYLIYFDEENSTNKDAAKEMVAITNAYLEKIDFECTELNRVERLINEQYYSISGGTINLMEVMPWLAYKLNADIYFLISVNKSTVELRCFYTKTPDEIAIIKKDIKINNNYANRINIYKNLQEVIQIVQKEVIKTIANGVKYTLYVKTYDNSEKIDIFRQVLSERIKKIEEITSQKDMVVYDVYLLAKMEYLEKMIYEIAKQEMKLNNFRFIMQTENSLKLFLGF